MKSCKHSMLGQTDSFQQQLCHNFQYLCHHLLSTYQLFIHYYYKVLIKYLGSLDGDIVLANFCIFGPERYFIYYDFFKCIFVNDWN